MDVTSFQDLQGCKKLLPPEACPIGISTGEGRERPDHRLHNRRVIKDRAIGGVDAPDGEHDGAVDAIGCLDRIESLSPFSELATASADTSV
jgi:hypothetical protein